MVLMHPHMKDEVQRNKGLGQELLVDKNIMLKKVSKVEAARTQVV